MRGQAVEEDVFFENRLLEEHPAVEEPHEFYLYDVAIGVIVKHILTLQNTRDQHIYI